MNRGYEADFLELLGDGLAILYTVWKFHNFSITQILREITFRASRSAKYAILTQLEAVNFDFYEFLHFLECDI